MMSDRWSYLSSIERQFLQESMVAYDRMSHQHLTIAFLNALSDCQSLDEYHNKASPIPCEVIKTLLELHQQSHHLFLMLEENALEVNLAFQSVLRYVKTIDNWRISPNACELGLGVRDHCNILLFLLSLHQPDRFQYLFGNFNTPAKICDFLKQAKGIDLTIDLAFILEQSAPSLSDTIS